MDAFLLLAVGIALAVGWLINDRNDSELRKVMAALENLESELGVVNTKLGDLATAVNRVVAIVDPAREVRIQTAANSVKSIGDTLVALKDQINAVAPPQA